MEDTILTRITRIYAAIGGIEENDPNKLKATVIQTDKFKFVFQDFRGDLSDDELSNQVHTVINNIANLRGHLGQWAAHHGHDRTKVDRTFRNSLELRIVHDLSNNDKHPYPPRNGGHSGKSPKLIEINRLMRLQTQAQKNSMSAMAVGADGMPKFLGNATPKAVVTGDVVDNEDNRIGDLYDIANKAVDAWERLLVDFGLIPITDGT